MDGLFEGFVWRWIRLCDLREKWRSGYLLGAVF